jgi:hypothetical protein
VSFPEVFHGRREFLFLPSPSQEGFFWPAYLIESKGFSNVSETFQGRNDGANDDVDVTNDSIVSLVLQGGSESTQKGGEAKEKKIIASRNDTGGHNGCGGSGYRDGGAACETSVVPKPPPVAFQPFRPFFVRPPKSEQAGATFSQNSISFHRGKPWFSDISPLLYDSFRRKLFASGFLALDCFSYLYRRQTSSPQIFSLIFSTLCLYCYFLRLLLLLLLKL